MAVNPLDKLATLMWNESKQQWQARARGSNVFVSDADPEQAILKATTMEDAPYEASSVVGGTGTQAGHQASIQLADR